MKRRTRLDRVTAAGGRKLVAVATAGIVGVTAFAVPASSAPASSTTTHQALAAHEVAASPRGSIDSRVFGYFGRQGTVRGTFAPDRSFGQGGADLPAR